MENKKYGKQMKFAGGQREIAKHASRAELSLENNKYRIPMDNKQILLEDSVRSQKMHLQWTSVWRT
eukprot:10980321-Karenia_brevis.AAC.1